MPALHELPNPARVAAHHQNAAKSTGPRTEAGKARSRCNAVKHGLTGAGLALPDEDAQVVQERFAALRAELGPKTVLGNYYVGRIAVAIGRTERAVRHEAKALAHRMRHAEEVFDQQRHEAAAEAWRRLAAEPRAARRELLLTPEGVDLLIEALLDLRACVGRVEPDWSIEREVLLRDCCGWRDDEIDPTPGVVFSRAVLGDDSLLSDAHRAEAVSSPEPALWAALALARIITAEVARLRAHRERLDHESIANDRVEAAERALFDPSPAAQLARRYEAAAAREVNQSLDRFHVVEAAATTDSHPETAPISELAPEPEVVNAPELIEEFLSVTVKVPQENNLSAVLASFGNPAPRGGSLPPTDSAPRQFSHPIAG